MGSIWKKIGQVVEVKMPWFSGTHTKRLTDGRVIRVSEVRSDKVSCV